MSDESSRVVLVTGGSRGIGRAIALDLSAHGYAVIVHGRSDRARLDGTVTELRAHGGEAAGLLADLSDPGAIRHLVEQAVAWKGRLDGLVTSAGIFRGESLSETTPELLREVLGTDLEGTLLAIRGAAPELQRRHGSVVTISSVLGAHATEGATAYQAAKAGVEQMTRALAIELAPDVRVNCVAPGYIRTDMNAGGHGDPIFSQKVVRATPLGRWGEPEDVAPAVRFLLDDRSTWITGAVLPVDGGIPLR